MNAVTTPLALLLVALGGGTGAAARYLLGKLALHLAGPGYPWGTLAANILGGFAMGVLAAVLAWRGGSEAVRLLLGVGVLGGFTTFSAFSLEVVLMIERGELPTALGYMLLSVTASVVALFAGLWLVRTVTA